MCGIIGFSGYKKEENYSNYNIDKLKLLMYYNSIERTSKDSTGMYFKGITSPIKSVMNAEHFIKSPIFNDNIKESNVFIGHVRSKSLGTINSQNAHPYQVKNIIGVHNGTITNIDHLVKKIGITINGKDLTDSYKLYKCLSHMQTPTMLKSVLGGCTLLFTDLITPDKLYVFKKDRSLFLGYNDEGMYISSELKSLQMIGCKDTEDFKENTFYTIENGAIVSSFKLESKTTSSMTTTEYTGQYAGRWIKAIKPLVIDGIIENEWYLIDTASYRGQEVYSFNLCAGRTITTPYALSDNKKANNCWASFFDINNVLPVDNKAEGLLVKAINKIYFKNEGINKEKRVAFDKDDYLIIKSYDTLTSQYIVYNPYTTISISGIGTSDIRPCTDEEELEFSDTIKQMPELYDVSKVDLKFKALLSTEAFKDKENELENIINSLTELNKEIKFLYDSETIKKKIDGRLTYVIDELEQATVSDDQTN